MVRKLILAVVILAMAAVPLPALAREGGHGFHGGFHGGHEFRGGHERHEGHEHFERFHEFVFYPSPYYTCPSPYDAPYACYWQPGY
jgi:hypothetical protein